jgi:hypothetical protein
VFQERFIGGFARDAYYQKERVSNRNDVELDVSSVCVFDRRYCRTDLQTDFL